MAIKPVICGGTEVFVPECDPCDEFEYRVEALEDCCDEARETLADHEQRITANTNAIANKMDRLVAGENIVLDGDTISATDTKYTAGDNISISGTTISGKKTTVTESEETTVTATTSGNTTDYKVDVYLSTETINLWNSVFS